jgi:hypothetical protein
MFNTEGDIAKAYVEYEDYEEYDEEFNTDMGLFRGYHSRMDDEEQRYQLLDSINRSKEDAMYDDFGNKIYTISNTKMLKELGKFAVKEIIAKPMNYSTKTSEEEPVKMPPAHRSMAHSSPVNRSPALSKSKRIAVKQPSAHSSPAHSSPALSNFKKIAVKQPPAHSSPTKQPSTTSRPPALAQA